MNKDEIINAVLNTFAESNNKTLDYVYGFMDAVGALREYLNNLPSI